MRRDCHNRTTGILLGAGSIAKKYIEETWFARICEKRNMHCI